MNAFGSVLECFGLAALGRRISNYESRLADINSNVGHSLNDLLNDNICTS